MVHTDRIREQLREKRAYVWTAFSFLIFFLLLGLVTETGYRIFSTLGLTDAGTVKIVLPDTNMQVYHNDTYVDQSSEQGEIITLNNLPTGEHSIIVARQGSYPWAKKFKLTADETRVLEPFLIRHKLPQRTVDSSADHFAELVSEVQRTQVPTKESPLSSPDQPVLVWVENNVIQAQWEGDLDNAPHSFCVDSEQCLKSISALPSDEPIKNITFYHNRSDVILFSSGNGIYALELVASGAPSFQPIFEGTDPNFIKTGTTTIAVLDDGQLFEVGL
ncbi:MAG: hypothetical protein WDZ82_01605 [Candidatus Paceibacterota bacterium]